MKCRSLRHPRTTQEKRANEGEALARNKRRGPYKLPSVYDDIWIHTDRSWKSKRKTKYRVVKEA